MSKLGRSRKARASRSKASLLVAAAALTIYGCKQSPQENAADSIEANAENAADVIETAGATQPTVFCAVVKRRVSSDDCDDLAVMEKDAKEGVGAFNVPDPMTKGKSVSIVLVIDRRSPEEIAAIETPMTETTATNAAENVDENIASAEASVDENNVVSEDKVPRTEARTRPRSTAAPTPSQRVEPLEGRTETIVPKVGRFMSAELDGDRFDIDPRGARSEEIPPGEQASWEWKVTPTAKGAGHLTLKTIVEGEIEGKRYSLSRTEKTKSVTVNITRGDQIREWIDSAIDWLNRMKLLILAIVGVVGALMLLKSRIWNKTHKTPPDE
jgi:hypothetical protein